MTMMKKMATVCLLSAMFSSCALAATDTTSSSSTENQSLAAAWCEKKSGKVYIIKTGTIKAGKAVTTNKCLLPSGELVEIWALYKRDHK